MKQIFELKKSPVAKKKFIRAKEKNLAKPFFFFSFKTFSIIETSSLLESSPRHFFDSQKMKLERKHFFCKYTNLGGLFSQKSNNWSTYKNF